MNTDNTNDLINVDTPKMSTGLNVLTILTFIGCAVLGLLTLLSPMINKWALGFMDKAASSGQELSAKQLADMEKGRAAIELSNQNMIPMMVIGMAGIILCFVGALWMRKLKKEGFWLYAAGEIVPLLGGLLIMGTAQFTSAFSIILGVGIPITFVVLYALQRKYLVK